jgi:hypothetical protein
MQREDGSAGRILPFSEVPMRRFLVVGCIALLSASSAAAQDPFPVSVGVGGGFVSGWDNAHAMVVVGFKPAKSPIGLRLDGIWAPPNGRFNRDLLTAASVSAVVTLRPWRVAPYLIVGATRTSEYAFEGLTGTMYTSPAVTQLTGGLGFETKLRGGRMFLEMRELRHSGIPLSLGFSF